MTDRPSLTPGDVERLLHTPSAETRAETAAGIADYFDRDALSPQERQLAMEIFRLLVRDAAVLVRESLARHLESCPHVPHDVARALADDVESVAVPVLEHSEALTDADLIEIVGGHVAAKQEAVARRDTVSSAVSEAVVATGNEGAVARLVDNAGAVLTETTLQKVLDTFPESERVKAPMVYRRFLPATVAERLVHMLSDTLQAQLAARHTLPEGLAEDVVLHARERATVGLAEGAGDAQMADMLAQMHANGRLTASIVLRAECMGDMRFFEAAMAELADVPLRNTWLLIHDSGPLGLRNLYQRAGLPPAYLPAARAAVAVMRETELDGEPHDRERYSRRVIERILTQYGDLGVTFEESDLEYLLDRMRQLPATFISDPLERRRGDPADTAP